MLADLLPSFTFCNVIHSNTKKKKNIIFLRVHLIFFLAVSRSGNPVFLTQLCFYCFIFI